ncbi:MAG: DNA repair protein RadA [Lachnospiraceae bacterium]|nr:DNA repair protein RadA [Lachnospiraceae bacterium]
MPKSKTVFFCKECGNESPKWLGKCPACGAWDSFVEEPVAPKSKAGNGGAGPAGRLNGGTKAAPVELSKIDTQEDVRISTGIEEFDRVLGGGIVHASLVLVGGDPGIGKSTLLLQVCKTLVEKGLNVLYISGEESLRQIKMRADRLGKFTKELMLLAETSLDNIEEILAERKPDVAVIDSIQTMYREDIAASPGSVSQVRETTGALLRIGKNLGISIFIVGHVTKEGVVAGPRVLEHMVDTVLYFEGDNSSAYRVLRSVKNRFGSTNEVGVFEMQSSGLREVKNPSEYMLQGHPVGEPGSVIAASLEGTRPILVEVQALVCKTTFNMPRRTAAGTDANRVNLLMAVLEKRLGLQLGFCDAYVNVAGGLRVAEPAIDLAIVLAILSSFKNKPLPENSLVFGEVGLTGEIRGVSQAEQRVAEAVNLGYETCILPQVNTKTIKNSKIKLIGVSHVCELGKLL